MSALKSYPEYDAIYPGEASCMIAVVLSMMCKECVHYHGSGKCDAFPDKIPIALIDIGNHKKPFPGDNGIMFERKESPRPDWLDDEEIKRMRANLKKAKPYTDEEFDELELDSLDWDYDRYWARFALDTLTEYGIPLEDDESGD